MFQTTGQTQSYYLPAPRYASVWLDSTLLMPERWHKNWRNTGVTEVKRGRRSSNDLPDGQPLEHFRSSHPGFSVPMWKFTPWTLSLWAQGKHPIFSEGQIHRFGCCNEENSATRRHDVSPGLPSSYWPPPSSLCPHPHICALIFHICLFSWPWGPALKDCLAPPFLAQTLTWPTPPSLSLETGMLLNAASHCPLCLSEHWLSSMSRPPSCSSLLERCYLYLAFLNPAFSFNKELKEIPTSASPAPTSPRIQGSGHQVISTQQVQGRLRAREDRQQMILTPAKQSRAAAFASAMNAFTHCTPLRNRDALKRGYASADGWGEKFWYDWCKLILCIWLLCPELTCPGKNRFSFESFTSMAYVRH